MEVNEVHFPDGKRSWRGKLHAQKRSGSGQVIFRRLLLEIFQRIERSVRSLDLMLPKMDGYKVCGFLKKDTRYSRIPIIMFTARSQAGDEKLGLECGADAYLKKPFNSQELLAKIQELLATSAKG